jgi:hypothetical protein
LKHKAENEEAKMPDALNHWIGPFIPVVFMLSVVIANHVITGQRNDRKKTAEAARFCAALAAELRALLDLYKMNLDLIERKTNYLLSTRSSIAIYIGNLGRISVLLERPAIEHVVGAFAQNERIEAVVAAHSNLKCNLTYQFSEADTKLDEWKQMYEQAARSITSACQILEGGAELSEPWRVVHAQLPRDRASWLTTQSSANRSLPKIYC